MRAFEKLTPEQKENERIMAQVLDKYNSMREVLGPFNDELEAQWQATERLNPVLAAQRKETEKLEAAAKKLAEQALADLTKEQEKLKKEAEELNDRLDKQRQRLLDLPTDAAILEFAELKRTWEGLNEAEKAVATDRYAESLRLAAEKGHKLNEAQLEMVDSIGELDTKVEQSTAAENFTAQWNTAMGNLTADISRSITDIWSGDGSPLGKLGNAFVEFGKGALSAVTATLLTPLLNAFTNFATSIGTTLFSSITGAISRAFASAVAPTVAEAVVPAVAGAVAPTVAGAVIPGAVTAATAPAAGSAAASFGMFGAMGPVGVGLMGAQVAMGVVSAVQAKRTNKILGRIEVSTREGKTDTHGIRAGLATEEYTFASSWPTFLKLEEIGKTLTQTLWPIREFVVRNLPKIDRLITSSDNGLTELKAMGVSGSSRLTELQAIHANTNGLTASGSSRLAELKAIHANTNGLTAAIRSIPGPERFVPLRSGRIDPNGSSGGGADAKDIGQAVKDAIQGMKMDVDGRQLGRLVVRHQPLAAAELGGRR